MTRAGVLAIAVGLLGALLLPSAAVGRSYTFLNTEDLYPTLGAGTYGPANKYPSTLTVSGVEGKVTKARLTILGYQSARPTDTDLVLSGPNGKNVLLMADACGSDGLQNDNWTFDDAAPTYLSAVGPCANYQAASFKPSGYLGDDQADMRQFGAAGPPPPYLNALRFFNGSPANGAWRLYALDDTDGYLSFDIAAWALTLDVKTGKRAAALKKCKKIKDHKKRRRCVKKAKHLPE